jgi:hypothetical protein
MVVPIFSYGHEALVKRNRIGAEEVYKIRQGRNEVKYSSGECKNGCV